MEAGAAHTAYYEASAQAYQGDAEFRIEQFDHSTSTWTPAFQATLKPGWWVIYSRLADPPMGHREAGLTQGASELSYRARVDGKHLVHFAQRYRLVPTYFANVDHLFPFLQGGPFADDIEGVTHDDEWWYLSRTIFSVGDPVAGELARVRVGKDLSDENQWQTRDYDPSRALVYTGSSHAAEPEPPEWSREGFVHYGDITYAYDHVFVAIEGTGEEKRLAVGVFNTSLKPIGLATLSRMGNGAWVAFNPRTDLFYVTSPFIPGGDKYLDGFSLLLNSDTLRNPGPKNTIPATLVRQVVLQNKIGVQGGAFSERGTLWLLTNTRPAVLYAVDMNTGYAYWRAAALIPDNWEGEGVTVWDLDAGQAPGVAGQLHVQLFNNSPAEWSFWHLRANNKNAL